MTAHAQHNVSLDGTWWFSIPDDEATASLPEAVKQEQTVT